MTCLGITHFRTDKRVTEPNRSIHSLGETSDEVLKRENPYPLDIYSVNEHPHEVNEHFFPR